MASDKIREDEIMSDDELDNVAGGRMQESINDVQRAGRLGLLDVNPYNKTDIVKFCLDNSGELTKMFAKFGITFTHNEDSNKNNEYVYNSVSGGQRMRRYISQNEAWSIIEQKLGS